MAEPPVGPAPFGRHRQRAPGTGTARHRPRHPQEMAAASARPYIARRAGTSRAGLVRSTSPAVPLARTARAAL